MPDETDDNEGCSRKDQESRRGQPEKGAVTAEGVRGVADIPSIIIPSCNAGRQFAGLLESLRGQTTRCEIIVIDSSSSDDTVAIAGDHGARTIVIDRKDFDHGGTRNLGVRISSGDPLMRNCSDLYRVPTSRFATGGRRPGRG